LLVNFRSASTFKPQTPEEKATEAVMLATMAQYLERAYAP
jgi:hypothetical protein